jgi:transposase
VAQVADPVRARRLSDHEGQTLTQIVRRGRGNPIRVRRATIIMASSSGTPVAAIARLVAADEDTVRDVIRAFNEKGLAALDPQWAGGRPRLISDEDITFIVTTATTRPEAVGVAFTQWSVRKLAAHLGSYSHGSRRVRVGRERLRLILREHHISFQRTRTWKESTDPDKEAKLDRIEYVTSHFPMRCFAFDQFGPLSIRPCHGSAWARESTPVRLPATYHRTHGIRYFHGCYSLGDDQLWGVNRRRKGGDHSLAAIKSIRAHETRWGTHLRDHGQPVREQDSRRPSLGRPAQRRAVSDPDLRILGEPDRGPVRATADLHHGRLRSPQPSRAGAPNAGLSALAQQPRTPPRRARRATTGTNPDPQRTPPTLGPTTSGLTR